MRVPEIESPAESKVAFIDALEDECARDPNRIAWDNSKQRWLDLYTGSHFATAVKYDDLEPELRRRSVATTQVVKIVYNRVMNAVLAMLAGQVSNPPKIQFSARETGEPPIYYLNGFIKHPLVQQLAAQSGAGSDGAAEAAATYGDGHPESARAAAEAGMSVPLEEPFVSMLKQEIELGKMLEAEARMNGQPVPVDIVPEEALIEITDQTTAQFTQVVFDALWEQCGGLEATAENILNKKVLGWQATLFEFDRGRISFGESPVTITNVEGSNVDLDPLTSSFRRGRYKILYEPVSAEEGIAKYPDAADAIRGKSTSGTLNSRRRSRQSRLMDLEFSRDMCLVRTCWIRDWAYPMSPDEAVECGKVSVDIVDTGEVEQVPDMATGTVLERPVTRQTMVSADTGEQDVMPGHPSWPMVYGIREIRDIEGEIIFDRRCELPDIPIAVNINIPVPFSPYGIGEPDRLDGLQMAINKILSDLVEHHHRAAFPVEVRHEGLHTALGKEISTARVQAASGVIADQTLFEMAGGDIGKLISYLDPPQMGMDAWRLLEFLVTAIDREANNSDVQQGNAPAGTSGEWVANLQAAANQVAQVTSKATEAWLKDLVRLFVHFITREMTVEDIGKYTSKYPPAIIEAFSRKQKSLYLDLSVEVQSGTAAAKQGQTQAMIAGRQSGMQIAEPEIMRRLNLDPDSQLKEQAEWIQKVRQSGVVDVMAGQDTKGEEKKGNPKTGGE